jgi:L-amino acid N-acyltransferase YncA
MLEDYPKEIVIKDGTPVILRPLVEQDEHELLTFFARIPEEERWFLRENLADPDEMSEWIRNLDFKRVLPLVAVKEDGNTIIAIVRIHRRKSESLAHMAHLRIQVDPAYRQQRLGTWMLLDAIKVAMNMEVGKLVAEFVSGIEEAAVNAAQKLDFVQQALLKDYVKDRQGRYHDLIIMIKTLHSEWSDF